MAQTITQEVRDWIVQQAQSGTPAQKVLELLTHAGWEEETALEAMETSLQEHLQGLKREVVLPPLKPVPEPDLTENPNTIEVDGHVITVVSAMKNPRVVVFGNVLSCAECDEFMEAARPKLARSKTVDESGGGEAVHPSRTSDGAYFQRGESAFLKKIEARIAKLLNWPVENGEGMQVLRYGPNAEYKPHLDYFNVSLPQSSVHLKRGGQRVGTMVIYLNEPEKGGGTIFSDINLEVFPRKGGAVFFSYPRAHPSDKSEHGGSPVIAGEKWIATKWLREGIFPSGGG